MSKRTRIILLTIFAIWAALILGGLILSDPNDFEYRFNGESG